MKYREFGKTGLKVSALGFGTMRLPLLEDGVTVDEKEAVRIIRHAIDSGVNYVDTAYPYHQGTSEIVVGKALGDGYRDKVFLADKSPIWKLEKESDFDSILEEQLQKLQTDHIDFYLLHALNKERFEKIKNFHLIDHMLEARKAGKIRYLGFSFHDDLEMFKQIVDYTDQWDFCQIQYNYINRAYQAGDEGLTYAAEKGLAVIIMEPLLGGRLSKVPDHIATRLKQRKMGSSVASWAFRFAGSCPGVLTVLSGMTYMEHLQDNLRTYSPLELLTDEEKNFLEETAQLMLRYPTIPCNDCKYCMPCPYGLDIPAILLHYNKCINEGNVSTSSRDENYRQARRAFLVGYDRSVPRLRQASHCIGCNQCVPHCPQSIDIPKELRRIDRYVEDLKRGRTF